MSFDESSDTTESRSNTPSPKPFKEPNNLVTVDLSKYGPSLNETPLQEKAKQSKVYRIDKILGRIGYIIVAWTFLFLVIIFLVRKGYFGRILFPKGYEQLEKFEKCKNSKSLADCCYLFTGDEQKCTPDKLLQLFLQYEVEVNRVKRQVEPYYQEQRYESPQLGPFTPEETFSGHEIDLQAPNLALVGDDQVNVQEEDMFFQPATPPASSFTPESVQFPYNADYMLRSSHDQTQLEARTPYENEISGDQLTIHKEVQNFGSETMYTTTSVSKNEQAFSHTSVEDGLKSNTSKVTAENQTADINEARGSRLGDQQGTCSSSGRSCSNANSTENGPTSADIRSSERAGSDQNNEFNVNVKTDSFLDCNSGLQNSQSKSANPCGTSYPPQLVYYRPPSGYGNNLMMPVVPQSPLYVVNPASYPFISPQLHNYQSPQMINPYPYYPYQSYQNYPNIQTSQSKGTIVQTVGGGASNQFFMCNPIPPPMESIHDFPGIDIKRDSNLQAMLAAQPPDPISNKTRASINCPIGFQSCSDGSRCIQSHHICDNEVNCDDASDEIECSCKERVGRSRWCDGFLDCPNGEDEDKCFGCTEDEFSCDDWSKFRKGTCVSIEERCDGVRHCDITGKDEEDCSVLTDHIGLESQYKVSNGVGFLHRNYKGTWYPTCAGTQLLAMEVCLIESGPSAILPKAFMIPTNSTYSGPYVNKRDIEEPITVADSCMSNRAAFVECPSVVCGLRMTITNPFRSAEIDTSSEDEIDLDMEDVGDSMHSKRESEPVLGIARVVGGRASQPAAWPWSVSIYKNGIFHCGGVIVTESWILTAAHCVFKHWINYYEIQMGMLRRFSFSPMEQNRFATVVIAHEGYNKRVLRDDIALVKLSSPVRFNRYVRPICLPSEETAGTQFLRAPTPGTLCTTVGWGATIEHGVDPDHLREVEVPILDGCKHLEDRRGDEICAGLMEGGRDACQGDSGGPLMCRNVNNPSQWYLAGIVSHGEGCARPNEPGVYTRVSRYLGWIAEKIGERSFHARTALPNCPGYSCKGTLRCLPKRQRCDKVVDCLLGDDEMNCWQSTSFFGQMRLGSTQRSFLGDLVDTFVDTDLESNETTVTEMGEMGDDPSITTPTTTTEKPEEFFKCTRMLQMIPYEKRCDKVFDCEDGSDENDCTCFDYIRWKHPKAICDGRTDCKDLSDEANCEQCGRNEYLCRLDQKCIPLQKRCDGSPDCMEDEDERDCVALTNGETLSLDGDLRPKQSMKGIITINRFGVWRPLCTNTSDGSAASIASNVCNLLGLGEYTVFHKLSVEDKPVDAIIMGFSNRHRHQEKELRNSCRGLFVGCSDASFNSATGILQVRQESITSEAELYALPWNAVIYADGKFRCTGTILNSHWIVTSTACFHGIMTLNRTYISAVLGKGKFAIEEEGPHELTISISSWHQINSTDILLLRTENSISFSRYIKPSHLTRRVFQSSEMCVAIAIQNQDSQIMVLRSEECPETDELNFRCFLPVNSSAGMTCKEQIIGTIACYSKNGWYSAATFDNCNFTDSKTYSSISYHKYEIEQIMNTVPDDTPVTNGCHGFRCNLGNCIKNINVCDGIPHCKNSEDEEAEMCKELTRSCHLTETCACKPWELRCKNGKCVPKSAFCDQNDDCGDYSDQPDTCTCRSYLNLTHPEKICDGIINCKDRTDENPYECGCRNKDYQKCGKSDLCVSPEMVCDGVVDCPNGEDEAHCYTLRTNLARPKSGEVMNRTAGHWHSSCFPTDRPTTSELEGICEDIGFVGGSAQRLQLPPTEKDYSAGEMSKMDEFSVVWIYRNGKKKFRMSLRTGSEPYFTIVKDPSCHRLFLECI